MFTKVIARKIWRSFFWPTLYYMPIFVEVTQVLVRLSA